MRSIKLPAMLIMIALAACTMDASEHTSSGYSRRSGTYRAASRAMQSAEDAADSLLDRAQRGGMTYTPESTLERRLSDVEDALDEIDEDNISRSEYRNLERSFETLSQKTLGTLRYMGHETYDYKYNRFEQKLNRIERSLHALR